LSFGIVRGEIHQDADPPDPLALLLRARRERPRRSAAEQGYQLAPSYFGHGLLLGTRCGQLTARQGCRGRYRRSLAQA
jgi:hypothetical protein